MRESARSMCPNSSLRVACSSRVRSPAAMASIKPPACCSGTVMERTSFQTRKRKNKINAAVATRPSTACCVRLISACASTAVPCFSSTPTNSSCAFRSFPTSGVSCSSAKFCVATASPAPLSSQVLAVASTTALRAASTLSRDAFSSGSLTLATMESFRLSIPPAICLSRASYCCANTESVVTAPPITMVTEVSVSPRQRTAWLMRCSISITASTACAMARLVRTC